MTQKIYSKFLLALGISFVLFACNQQPKNEESATSVDTSSETTTATAETPLPENPMDAVKIAPHLYSVAKDTMGIRVLNITYKPGDSSAMHSHPDVVLYVINGGKSEFTEQDGSKHVNELKSGTSVIMPATTHSVKNVGSTTVKAILVEVNRPNKATNMDTSMNAVKIAPNVYKTIKDSMNLKVVMGTLKPGDISAMHSHPDYAIYVVQGGTAEFTDKDGAKQTNTLPTGAILIHPAEQHSAKNTGKTTIKVLLVEVNRTMQ